MTQTVKGEQRAGKEKRAMAICFDVTGDLVNMTSLAYFSRLDRHDHWLAAKDPNIYPGW